MPIRKKCLFVFVRLNLTKIKPGNFAVVNIWSTVSPNPFSLHMESPMMF